MNLVSLRRGIPAIVIAGALLVGSAAGGASAALLITGKQIKDNTVTTKDIKNGTLGTKDLSSNAVTSLKGARGPAGPAGTSGAAGPAGPAGPAGAAGAPGISGYELVSDSVDAAANTDVQVTATCPAGKQVLSGAAWWAGLDNFGGTQVSLDTNDATAFAHNNETVDDILFIDVICATVR